MSRPLCAALLAALTACPRASGTGDRTPDVAAPTPELYAEGPSDFSGDWVGESAGVFGKLQIERLAADRYYARFTSDDKLIRFVCKLEQVAVAPSGGGTPMPANLALFSWQDGRGGRGQGWVLINRDRTALSGEIRQGGLAAWDFVRADVRE